MKKLVLFIGLLLILQSSILISQTVNVNLSGRISGEFTMPTDNFYYPSDWGGAYLYVDDFVSSPSDTFLTINLNFNNDNSNDSLNIFFGLNEYSNSLIDSNNFSIIYDTSSFLTFLYYFLDLPDPNIDGIRILATKNNTNAINSIEIKLRNQHFDLDGQNFLMFCLDSNIPRGNVAWMPLKVGNVWEYNEYIPNEDLYSDFQYKITDSLYIDDQKYYVAERYRKYDMVWTQISQDTIKTDSLNNIIDKSNQYYFITPSTLGWWQDYVKYVEQMGRVTYVTELYDILPGLEIDGLAVADIGMLDFLFTGIGLPPNYDITLKGAKVRDKIVYGTITDIRENLSIQPKEFLLQQNYPNPFNPSTKISWQTPVSGWQTLKVYDVLGNEVATLVDEYRNAGSYEVEFKSSVGSRQLANGVYFYQLKAGEYVEIKKMILLK